ncbi:MAG: hypothetical protein KGH75_00545 [Rhodospirillales bacterium]|nr:hypothetical protein [Rhodospirillales bacterium]
MKREGLYIHVTALALTYATTLFLLVTLFAVLALFAFVEELPGIAVLLIIVDCAVVILAAREIREWRKD